ncbi:MAG TPA: hypothetical protein VNX40_13345 [Mucilaginibacter sp.]|jgi:hypothetical protein|nr:hypothetical protein [Mucilaginibacter sp.]
MNLTISYTPNIGVIINEAHLNWGAQRELVRKLLNSNYQVQDRVYDDIGISQKRDIYKDYNGSNNFFFLNYDENNLLFELEVHAGADIMVGGVLLSFEKELSVIINDLQIISPLITKIRDGEYFFRDLQLTVSDQEAMGGEGNALGYFYCSVNTDHLIEE